MKLPEVVSENDAFIVLNKPAGLLSVPDRTQSAPSLKDILTERFGSIFTIHRLDRDTSGLIIFAKTAEAHRYLSMAFEERAIQKIYQGVTVGRMAPPEGIIEEPMLEHPAKNGTMIVHKKGKPAATGYKTLEDFGRYTLVEFELFTGRTHQIRVHAQFSGHPIACDPLYGDGKPVYVSSLKRNYKSSEEIPERPVLGRLGLHASRLSFTYSDGTAYGLHAEMPKDMRALLNQLRKTEGK
jgi:23S rRNA pseudouridine1911/1915/1917 synthase